MKIEILGSNCKKCKKLEEVVRKVVAENNIDATIEKVKDTKKNYRIWSYDNSGFSD